MKGIKKIYYIALVLLGIMTIYFAVFEKKAADETLETAGDEAALPGNVADNNSEDMAAAEDISAWQLYENEEGKFRLDVPGDWTIKEDKDDYGNIIVTFVSPKTIAAVKKEIETMGQNYGQAEADMVISYSATISQETANAANGYGATTLEELIAKDPLITKIGDIELDGLVADEVVIGGEGDSYGIYIEKEGRLCEISFVNRADKAHLDEIDKRILETFEIE